MKFCDGSCHLFPLPYSMIKERWDPKSEYVLKNKTNVDVSARQIVAKSSCIVIDCCALLWIPHWPPSSVSHQPTVKDYVDKFKGTINSHMLTSMCF